MIADEIIARLLAVDPPLFSIVDGAAALAQIKDQPLAMPAAYVFVVEEASGPNERISTSLQRTEVDLSVIIIVSSVADPQGEAAAGSIDGLKRAVRLSLCGWQPPSAADLIAHVGGKLVKARDGTVWWDDRFGTAVYTPEDG